MIIMLMIQIIKSRHLLNQVYGQSHQAQLTKR